MKIDFNKFNEIILDFDGVILDSNHIKEKAITEASNKYLDLESGRKFVQYFVENNGVPREIKISNYFDKNISSFVLREYSDNVRIHINKAKFTKGLNIFLKRLKKYNLEPIILSGGDEMEINNILNNSNFNKNFKKILCGPETKVAHLKNLNLKGKILYIGDSRYDYLISKKFNLEFIFMYGYTQFHNWRNFFQNIDILCIKNFMDLIYDSK